MNLDFPVDQVPRRRVQNLARALRMTRDPDAYSSQLINAKGVRVYRIVVDNDEPIPLPLLEAQAMN